MSLKQSSNSVIHYGFVLDLIIYISVMFLIREIYFEKLSFIWNGLFWSTSTLIIAIWRMRVRKVSFKDLGLTMPKNLLKTILITAGILICIIASLVIFNILIDTFNWFPEDNSVENSGSKFANLKDNWPLFFSIIPLVLIESFLEELLDRGFMINWIEKVFSQKHFASILAVILQALIFGFRHSYDISERSITVAIIGLIMGIAYIKFGRNLWPLIIAHCILNTISMMDRV
ncbi:CPBP family intramembrane glutamic endopeptidase [Aureivirga sp. CE67]|uniref:CPBP family intramembrane glutamic endopeptidase n=1 Tax=Aureivirga sp. CE67 TaxID=1788983 RepID=UPI0018CB7C99|nr:CPBP family intramembrane glutamic endopeptidase [Aureivirga sp. CE67]